MSGKINIFQTTLALFVAIFLFVLCLYTLEKTGVPRIYATVFTAILSAILWLIVTSRGGTTRASKFFSADKKPPLTQNALAIGSSVALPIITMNAGALFFVQSSFYVVIAAAILSGMAISAILVSRNFHEVGATDISQFMRRRYNDTLTARSSAIVIALAGIGLSVVSVSGMALLIGWFFNLSQITSLILVIGFTTLTAAIGGASSNTRFAAMAFVLLLIALNLPLFLHSINSVGFPIGQLSFGYGALEPIKDLEQQLSGLSIPLAKEIIGETSALFQWSAGRQILAGIVIVFAIAIFPPMIQQFSVCNSSERASSALNKAILFTGFMLVSCFALMAYTKFGLYQLTLGLSLSEARVEAPFLFSWSGRPIDLITLCDKVVANEAELLTACAGGIDHVLNTTDFVLENQLLVAAAPDLTAMPYAYTALLSVALIFSLLSFSSMIVLSTANSIMSAFYATLPGKVASGRIFFTRLMILFLASLAGLYGLANNADLISLLFFSLSVLAASLGPAMFIAIVFPRSTSVQASTAIALGFTISVLYFVLSKYGIDFVPETGDELQFTLPLMQETVPSELGAVFAVPITAVVFALMYAVSSANGSGTEVLLDDGDFK